MNHTYCKLTLMSDKKTYGHIYCLTSPSGKKYIGQCVEFLSNGRPWGYLNRIESHIRDAYNPDKDYCKAINAAIRKYGRENITIHLLAKCLIENLNIMESQYINSLNTLSPNGYNLTTGGGVLSRQSQETKDKRSASMIGKNVGKKHAKRKRVHSEDDDLPKYVRLYRDSTGKTGYRVCSHPYLNARMFVSKYESMEYKLQKALEYLNTVDNK